MIHKNQPVKTVAIQPTKLHTELLSPVALPASYFPETAPISYYAPVEVFVQPSQPSLIARLMHQFKRLLSINYKDVTLTPDYSGE